MEINNDFNIDCIDFDVPDNNDVRIMGNCPCQSQNPWWLNDFFLPEDFSVYVNPKTGVVINHPHPNPDFQRKDFPTFNHYTGLDGGYVAVYTRNKGEGIYSVGGGIYVAGQIRVQGKHDKRIFIPSGYKPGDNITQDPKLLELCDKYFPQLGKDRWVGGDTGGWFGIQEDGSVLNLDLRIIDWVKPWSSE